MATKEETFMTTIPDRYIRDETEKIQKNIVKSNTIINDIIDELLILRTTGIYPYINSITPLNLLIYMIIIIVFVILSNHVPWKLKHVMGFVLAIILVYYLNEGNRAENIDHFKTLEIHMEKIKPKPKFFYRDANLIEFAYNMMEYREYNQKAYEKMIQYIDQFLEIIGDIYNPALQNCVETLEIAISLKEGALNALHSLIHTLPYDDRDVIEKKLMNALKTLQLFLQRHVDEMIQICNSREEKKGWNYQTKRFDKHALPGPDQYKTSYFHIF